MVFISLCGIYLRKIISASALGSLLSKKWCITHICSLLDFVGYLTSILFLN
uniref:Uncharacterized protein n=1 Tax=Picea sitchensis TaxID=3332 RepID=B8LRJ1_PICSI|nr:unknown [Picea sitchensis]